MNQVRWINTKIILLWEIRIYYFPLRRKNKRYYLTVWVTVKEIVSITLKGLLILTLHLEIFQNSSLENNPVFLLDPKLNHSDLNGIGFKIMHHMTIFSLTPGKLPIWSLYWERTILSRNLLTPIPLIMTYTQCTVKLRSLKLRFYLVVHLSCAIFWKLWFLLMYT